MSSVTVNVYAVTSQTVGWRRARIESIILHKLAKIFDCSSVQTREQIIEARLHLMTFMRSTPISRIITVALDIGHVRPV